MQYSLINEIIVDNFAGGGGASTGIELATGQAVNIAINHDPDAILMHKTNHPFTKHHCESVWDVKPTEICEGHPVGLMWLSPDCKHFSRAKGSKPVSKNVRGLAWIAVRWAATVKPRVIILENVPEFITWGPLDKNNYPDKKQAGRTFNCFVNALRRCGYEVQWQELKACDYGAPTIRKRFFLIARCDGQPIVFPEATYGDTPGLKPYKTAADCIDFSIPCNSIFNRKKPLAENTMRRIARGLDKFTIKCDEPYIVTCNHGGEVFRGQSVDESLKTITAKCTDGVVLPSVQKYYGGVVGSKITEPLGTVTAIDHNSLLTPFLIQYHSETTHSEVRGQSLDKAIMTVDASPRYALTAAHIMKYYSGADNYSACSNPLHTIRTKDSNALIESHLCILRNHQDCKPLTAPMPTECTSAGHFAEVKTRIVKYNTVSDLGCWPEIRTLLNAYCDYNIAADEILLLHINDEDYFIADIGMRMLTPRELYNAQGFPADYIIDYDYTGKVYPKTKQVARCGNAVPPPFAEALVRANLPEMCAVKIITMGQLQTCEKYR